MPKSSRPEIVIGIDIGQTCSGVTYSIGPDWCEPRPIQKWPSRHGIERKDKVATRVGYIGEGLKSWGESCDWGEAGVEVREQFKLTLDHTWQDYRGYTSAEANRWYCDYLRSLHREISKYLDDHFPTWRQKRVEYNFSTPTTWRRPAMIAGVEKAIKSSGFTNTPLETVRMSLTEAEAAAVEAATTGYKNGDIFLICDAGGGTTDVNILRIQSTQGRLELEPLDHVEGVPIGSVLIDNLMAFHIMDRLIPIKEHLTDEVERVAADMLKGRFETIKHSFPNPITDSFDLEIRGLPGRQTFEDVGIYDSAMRIDRQTLRDIFDEQIQKIFELLDGRLTELQTHHPEASLSYIVLSGGFGSSPYLLEEVKRRYESNYGFTSHNTATVRIVRLAEPQLAVTRGLVRERIQQLGTSSRVGLETFRYRRCRNSYGVVVSTPYKEEFHAGLQYIINPVTKEKTVEQLNDWFIKRGDVIDVERGVQRDYGADLEEADRDKMRHVRIVMALDDQNQTRPPRQFSTATCEEVAMVKYRLTENDMKHIKRRLSSKPGYWKAEFKFVVLVGPADLQFEIRGKDGVLSTDHEGLEIEFFDEVHEPQADVLPNGNGHVPQSDRYYENIPPPPLEYGSQYGPITGGHVLPGQASEKPRKVRMSLPHRPLKGILKRNGT